MTGNLATTERWCFCSTGNSTQYLFFGGTDAEAEAPVLWPPHAKSWLIGKHFDAGRDWGQEEKVMAEDEMARWHHWLDGHEFKWLPGVGDGQGRLAFCGSWGRKELDTTERLNWTEQLVIVNYVPILSIILSTYYVQSARHWKHKDKSWSPLSGSDIIKYIY